MTNHHRKKAILFHEILGTNRLGMQTIDSRYVMSATKIKKILEWASISQNFETFQDDYFNHTKTELTIDDGGGSNILFADLLYKFGIRGRFFITTSFIEKENFLSVEEIKYIRSLGHIIGSHSHSHSSPFCELSKKQIEHELSTSKKILENILKEDIQIFSVPGGEVRGKTLLDIAHSSCRFKNVYTSTPHMGVFRIINDCHFLGRYSIEDNMSIDKVISVAQGRGWLKNRINYQLRRLRREIIYKLKLDGIQD